MATWLQGALALVLAIVAFNVHVSARGDALSSLGRGERQSVYAAMLIADAILLAACALRARSPRSLAASFGFGMFASVASLLLDVQDGPVRTVQLVWLVGLFLSLLGIVRIILSVGNEAVHT